jgi:hypothetical protein
MKKQTLGLAALLLSGAMHAQTLKIFHKSHSGGAASFEVSTLDHFGWFGPPDIHVDSITFMRMTLLPPLESLPTPPLIPVPEFTGPIPPLQDFPVPEESKVPETAKPKPPPPSKPTGRPAEGSGHNEGQHTKEIPCAEDKGAAAEVAPAESGSRLPWGVMGMASIPLLVVASGAMRRRERKPGSAQKKV